MRIEISRSLLAKLLKLTQLDYYDNRVYEHDGYYFIKLSEDEQIELRMLDKELLEDQRTIKVEN